MESQPTAAGHWEADLNDFFATIDRENQDFSQNLTRQGEFYARTARPALDAAAEALRRHGRTCETGLDQHRIYLIVRRFDGPVEFQYAIVAEARIEGLTPYVHCWFEENTLAEAGAADSGQAATADEQQTKDANSEDDEDDEESDEDEQDDQKKDAKKPSRTKTIELLSTWSAERQIESVTQEEILADFVSHYKEAVARLRTHLHATPLPEQA